VINRMGAHNTDSWAQRVSRAANTSGSVVGKGVNRRCTMDEEAANAVEVIEGNIVDRDVQTFVGKGKSRSKSGMNPFAPGYRRPNPFVLPLRAARVELLASPGSATNDEAVERLEALNEEKPWDKMNLYSLYL